VFAKTPGHRFEVFKDVSGGAAELKGRFSGHRFHIRRSANAICAKDSLSTVGVAHIR
jgi:hypothetical protein